eukprot:4311805-Alexandrium_andersonii.AAC.1
MSVGRTPDTARVSTLPHRRIQDAWKASAHSESPSPPGPKLWPKLCVGCRGTNGPARTRQTPL